MFRAVRRSSSGALTVFAATGLHTHVVTGCSQVWVGTGSLNWILSFIVLCGVWRTICVGWLPYLGVKSVGTNIGRSRCLSVLKFSQMSFQLDHVSFIYLMQILSSYYEAHCHYKCWTSLSYAIHSNAIERSKFLMLMSLFWQNRRCEPRCGGLITVRPLLFQANGYHRTLLMCSAIWF
jgi:hypothetical protein